MKIADKIIVALGGYREETVKAIEKDCAADVEAYKTLFKESQKEVARLSKALEARRAAEKTITAEIDMGSMPAWITNSEENTKSIVGAKVDKRLLAELEPYITREVAGGKFTATIRVQRLSE